MLDSAYKRDVIAMMGQVVSLEDLDVAGAALLARQLSSIPQGLDGICIDDAKLAEAQMLLVLLRRHF